MQLTLEGLARSLAGFSNTQISENTPAATKTSERQGAKAADDTACASSWPGRAHDAALKQNRHNAKWWASAADCADKE